MTARLLAIAVTAVALPLGACGGGETARQPNATPDTAAAPAAAAQAPAVPTGELPPGVTPAMVAAGDTLFHGAGICHTCHGENATGVTGLGPNLTDAQWLHSDGSYDAIVKQITTGVPANVSTNGVVMPPKGGSSITDDQVKDIAAYVYSLRFKS
jgi:mono/diheme cytochrome c family protein